MKRIRLNAMTARLLRDGTRTKGNVERFRRLLKLRNKASAIYRETRGLIEEVLEGVEGIEEVEEAIERLMADPRGERTMDLEDQDFELLRRTLREIEWPGTYGSAAVALDDAFEEATDPDEED